MITILVMWLLGVLGLFIAAIIAWNMAWIVGFAAYRVIVNMTEALLSVGFSAWRIVPPVLRPALFGFVLPAIPICWVLWPMHA